MKHILVWPILLSAALYFSTEAFCMDATPHAVINEVPLARVKIEDDFWTPRQEMIRTVTLPAEWEQMEKHHHLNNFRVLAGRAEGVHLGPVYADSDLYKWLEAASYFLQKNPEDEWIRDRVSEVVGLIGEVQMEDGYINTYYQSFAPEARWTNLWMNHELYCAGHLIEAGCAHFHASGNEDLIGPATRLADHVAERFRADKAEEVPGHQEIELALVRLYRTTGDTRYLDAASYFIHQRGKRKGYVKALLEDAADQASLSRKVAKIRKPYLPEDDKSAGASYGFTDVPLSVLPRAFADFRSGRYFQRQKPIEEQTAGVGHSVRAMYYYAGATDLYLEIGEERLLAALSTIWDNTVNKRTYVTGGMGSLPVTEGFGRDYELPNRSYAETCAAAGSVFFSHRMLMAGGEAKYADQIERTLYNGFLSGLSLDGKKFFYRNPLASYGKDERQPWYQTACCPPNIARLIASIERYVYGENEDGIYVHQFVGGEASFTRPEGKVLIGVKSGFPWDGKVLIAVDPEVPMSFTLFFRRPIWARRARARLNGEPRRIDSAPGDYVGISRAWQPGDALELDYEMEVEIVESDPRVKENAGKVSVVRGPLVYCLEDKDNPGLDVHGLFMARVPELEAEFDDGLLGGVVKITGKTHRGETLTAIPYYAWANRGKSDMAVWIGRD